MAFKIINITDNMDRRSVHYNKPINIDNWKGQTTIPPGQTIIINSPIIPITIRKLQLEGKIKLDHLTDKESRDLLKPPPPQKPPKPTPIKPIVKEVKKVVSKKKPTPKKPQKKKKT